MATWTQFAISLKFKSWPEAPVVGFIYCIFMGLGNHWFQIGCKKSKKSVHFSKYLTYIL